MEKDGRRGGMKRAIERDSVRDREGRGREGREMWGGRAMEGNRGRGKERGRGGGGRWREREGVRERE